MITATTAHAEAMAWIHAQAFRTADAWGSDAFALQLAQPSTFGLLDERGGLVLARAIAEQAEVLTLAVVPAERRQGIGTALVTAALAEAARRGARAMFLEVANSNRAARMLYDRLGFVQSGWRPRYYSDGTDALILRLPLPPD